MQPGEKKKLIVLAALIGVIAAIWGYRFISDGRSVAPVSDTGLQMRRWGAPPTKQVSVKLGLLNREKPQYKVGRNIFNPTYTRPEVKPPAASPAAPPKKAETPMPAPPPPPPPKTREELMKEKAEKEMKNFKFVGFLKRSDRTDVFLTLDKDYFVASVGQEIAKGYYLKEIGRNFLLFEHPESGALARLEVDFEEVESKASTVPSPGSGGGAGGSPSGSAPRAAGSAGRGSEPTPAASPSPSPIPGVAAGLPASTGETEEDDEGDWDDEDWDDEDEDEDFYQEVTEPDTVGAGAPEALKNRSTW